MCLLPKATAYYDGNIYLSPMAKYHFYSFQIASVLLSHKSTWYQNCSALEPGLCFWLFFKSSIFTGALTLSIYKGL